MCPQMSEVNGFFISYKKSSWLHNEHASSSGILTLLAIFSGEEFLRMFNASVSRHDILIDIMI